MAIHIQVLFSPGCPHAGPTGELICAVAREQDLHITLEERLVPDLETARTLRFQGSPTVLVDGVDLEPWARQERAEATGFG